MGTKKQRTLRDDVEFFLERVNEKMRLYGAAYTEHDDEAEAFVALGEAAMNFMINSRRKAFLRNCGKTRKG